jgi:hypothetical protein
MRIPMRPEIPALRNGFVSPGGFVREGDKSLWL